MTIVRSWTGREARMLRHALRFSVRAFAEHLGVAVRTVSKWEAGGELLTPRPDLQAALDTVLERADANARCRFDELLSAGDVTSTMPRPSAPLWDEEVWLDDLERARLHADRQDFAFASRLIERWLGRSDGATLSEHAHHLRARSLVLLGDIQRDQGRLRGPRSARAAYRSALATFEMLDAARRVGHVQLLMTVTSEMSGDLERSALAYRAFAEDERLSPLNRARAQLWIGTALTKTSPLTDDRVQAAIRAISDATQEFEVLDEPDEWGVAHQKMALAHLAAGDPSRAHRAMDIAVINRRQDSPLQRVRLDTARAHVLLADRASRDSALVILDRARREADEHRLTHQVSSIDRIRQDIDTRLDAMGIDRG
jgi:transcriptional regulator with XRE-family HTH domain